MAATSSPPTPSPAVRAALAAAAVLAAAAAGPAARADLVFTGLGGLRAASVYTTGDAISRDGSVVVGTSLNESGDFEAYRWSADTGVMTGLGTLPGVSSPRSRAYGVSPDGRVVVGESKTSVGGVIQTRAFRSVDGGRVQLFGPNNADGAPGSAYDASAAGHVVGRASSSRAPNNAEAYRWTEAGGTELLGILPGGNVSSAYGISDDGAVVVGYSDTAGGNEAFRWTAAGGMVGLGDLAGGSVSSFARATDSAGDAVVGWSRSDLGQEVFLWTADAGMTGLGMLPGRNTAFATSVADGGRVVVGGMGPNPTSDVAFHWTPTGGLRRLDDVLTEAGLDLTGWELTSAQVSADGLSFSGTGRNPDDRPEAWFARIQAPAPVPEPGTLWLLAAAGAAAAGRRRLRGAT